ncbi:MAG TPA: YciI family protein [Myxococcota bacterium]
MKYLALIYADEKRVSALPEAARQALHQEYFAYETFLANERHGHKIAGEALQPTTTATTVRIRDGKRLVTDGPFAETKEQLGGFYMYEAKDLDEALELAARIPDAKNGSIEVRPIMPFDIPTK